MRPQWGLRAELTEAAVEAARKKSCFPHHTRRFGKTERFCFMLKEIAFSWNELAIQLRYMLQMNEGSDG